MGGSTYDQGQPGPQSFRTARTTQKSPLWKRERAGDGGQEEEEEEDLSFKN